MMTAVHPVAASFEPMLNLPSWKVERGYGSFVTMEFGEPFVEIRRPAPMPVFIEGAPGKTLQRDAYIHGQWHLWIYCCDWQLTLNSVLLAHSESDDITMNRALGVLNGQALTGVKVWPHDGRSQFTFDLGCTLTASPYPDDIDRVYRTGEPDELWLLCEPSGQWLTVRADGTYCHVAGKAPAEEHHWQPIGERLAVGQPPGTTSRCCHDS
jgi:hypothetical protein